MLRNTFSAGSRPMAKNVLEKIGRYFYFSWTKSTILAFVYYYATKQTTKELQSNIKSFLRQICCVPWQDKASYDNLKEHPNSQPRKCRNIRSKVPKSRLTDLLAGNHSQYWSGTENKKACCYPGWLYFFPAPPEEWANFLNVIIGSWWKTLFLFRIVKAFCKNRTPDL